VWSGSHTYMTAAGVIHQYAFGDLRCRIGRRQSSASAIAFALAQTSDRRSLCRGRGASDAPAVRAQRHERNRDVGPEGQTASGPYAQSIAVARRQLDREYGNAVVSEAVVRGGRLLIVRSRSSCWLGLGSRQRLVRADMFCIGVR
jgi:hypothetical protein